MVKLLKIQAALGVAAMVKLNGWWVRGTSSMIDE
jgi:hypothetical protein